MFFPGENQPVVQKKVGKDLFVKEIYGQKVRCSDSNAQNFYAHLRNRFNADAVLH